MARPKRPEAESGVVDAPGDDAADPLFAVPPEQFVAARNELVSKLQASGNRKAASEIKSLGRPSVAVWTINQLSRRLPEKVAALLEAGKRLRKSQGSLGGGPDSADELRASAHAERQALRDLIRAAGEILSEADRKDSSSLLGRIESTLHAIATGSGDFGELLRAGRLTKEVEPEGFPSPGGTFSISPAPRPPGPGKAAGKAAGKAQQREGETARAELKAAQRAANAQAASLRKAEQKAQQLADRVQRAQFAADKARMDADKAKAEVLALRKELEDAKQRIDRASAGLAAATQRR
ncbi:MAG TPA: hypothetical protein VEM39_12125 [Myxococcaceae bacterium]|nr:hypothetical protein [Myxococcaceae bacterium]